MDKINLIKILWDYMKVHDKLSKADVIIGLGSEDVMVAKVAAKLYHDGYASKIIFSGGLGKITYKMWNVTEAEKFKSIAINCGVPNDEIYLEKESTNTNDNIRFSKKIIESLENKVKKIIIVCKPYSEKRTYAIVKRLMPEYEVIIVSEDISFEDYLKSRDSLWIDGLVGEIQRMKLFAEKGWQASVDIPKNVWNAYEKLVALGYDKFIFKDFGDDEETARRKSKELYMGKL